MSTTQDWVKKYKRKFTIERLLRLLFVFIPFILAFIFGFLGGEMKTYIDEQGRRIVEAKHPELVIAAIICSAIFVVSFIISFISIMFTRIEIAHYKGHTIMAYILNKKVKLIIDGVEQETLHRMNYRDFVFLNGITSDGIKVTCKIAKVETHFNYEDLTEGNNTVIIHNHVTASDGKHEELTPLQKKLVEHAKNDVLASIDPNDVKDSKKKLDLYNQLDELDDK